jgi:hypothetical protein
MSKKKKSAHSRRRALVGAKYIKQKGKKARNPVEPVISIIAQDRENAEIDVPLQPGKKEVLKQKRATMSSVIALTNVAVFGAILSFGFVYLSFFKHETKSDEENRYLAEFPDFSLASYINGDYTEGIADYFDDTVHGRASIKKFISDKIMPLKGKPYGEDEVELHGAAFVHSSSSEPETVQPTTAAVTTAVPTEASTAHSSEAASASSTAATTAPPTTATEAPTHEREAPAENQDDMNAADGEVTNNILIVNNRGITLYGGGWGNETQYAEYLNEYKKALPDVNVYSMVLPTASSYYLPDKYKSLAASEKDDFDRMEAAFDGVKYVDAYTALEKHTDEPIYSRTDHHWQPLGAYYAAQAFAESAGVPFPELSSYEKIVVPGYVGSLYTFTKSSKLSNNPEDFVIYKPKTNTVTTQYNTAFQNPQEVSLIADATQMSSSGFYMAFGADNRIAHVKTECKNGRTLVIFKDSYGNALLPFLTSSFENIYLCDIRYFDLNAASFIKEVGATDLLFSMCSYSAVGVNRNNIYNNLHK